MIIISYGRKEKGDTYIVVGGVVVVVDDRGR
jgi:hypothetical protein